MSICHGNRIGQCCHPLLQSEGGSSVRVVEKFGDDDGVLTAPQVTRSL